MYLKNIVIKNIGPIEEVSIELPFHQNGNPKPIIFVGENGSGKTILLSQIMDSFYEIGSKLFDNIPIHDGFKRNFYKLSGGINLRVGGKKGFSLLKFFDDKDMSLEYCDEIGDVTEENFRQYIEGFDLLPTGEKHVTVIDDLRKKELQKEWNRGAYFYQPAYRYEEPFWKNDSFLDYIKFEDKKTFLGQLGKELEIVSSVNDNKAFLLDLVLDNLSGRREIDQNTWNNINTILQKIKKRPDIRFGLGPRGSYRVSIINVSTNKNLIPSIDQLSLGELVLLNLFLNIIRHGDSNPPIEIAEIQGIVVIDEIDVHLHTDLQNSVLPTLIQLFSKVQFIITTHSPIFLLGMKKTFGEDKFEIRNMPKGEIITTERFSEFENAYRVLKDTEKFENEIKEQIVKSTKPILFVEGDYDIRYLKKAAELLQKTKLLEMVEIRDGNGWGNLDKIKSYFNNKTKLSEIVPQEIILLYDCDTGKKDKTTGKVHIKVIPTINNNIIEKGIENLFSKSILEKAIAHKKAYIDITSTTTKTIRGDVCVIPEKWEINKDEKGNLCDWICKHGTEKDFEKFKAIFSILEEIINKPSESIS